MKILFLFLLLLLNGKGGQDASAIEMDAVSDTMYVLKLNSTAFENRLKNPELSINQASKALLISQKLSYDYGIAEAYRVIGVSKYYLNKLDESVKFYLMALTYFKKAGSQEGEAKVYNNIGGLYRDINYEKSLVNFYKSLKIAQALNLEDLEAGLYLNIGTVNQRKKKYTVAESYYLKSSQMFTKQNNIFGLVQSNQNLGLIYLNLKRTKLAEDYLRKAEIMAKKNKIFNSLASIHLTLSSLYIAEGNYEQAKTSIREGTKYSHIVKDRKLEYNFLLASYELELKLRNYQKALYFLQRVFQVDSITYKSNISDKISLLEAQHKQLEKQRENELTIAKQKYTQVLIWGVSAIAILAFVVIFLLIKNVRKSKHTNLELTRLNQEILRQKDDLDRANHNLEEIIDQRTSDLKIKNKKLSEYSSYLSHQVRSPVATLKGLLLLEKDHLIDQKDLIVQLNECIHNLDDKIVNINENLNNPHKAGLISEE